jgi:ADP-ribose pyrophosphatase YjhB (NUDIX family)
MVQRKNSLGYLEFIRGRYMIDNKESIKHLVEQMSPNEINDILKLEFDDLWNNLWDNNNIRNKNHYKEYISSKQKFNFLKLNKLDLLNSLKPLYLFNEWGFPKGRRESYESDLVCAIREFEEETNYIEKQYTILEQCKLIKENLKGTNNINYAHNYFLAILNEKNEYYDKTNREVGDIKIMNLNECIDSIRPYHNNKIKIIKHLYNVIKNFLEEYDL